MAIVSIGRSRLPPDSIRWLAIWGIIVTSDPVRDRIVVLTRSMSAVTRSIRRTMEAEEGLSNGTTTAKGLSGARTRANGRAKVNIETRLRSGKSADVP